MCFVAVDWIRGYEDMVDVNHTGVVRRVKTREPLEVHTNARGFRYVTLCKGGRSKKVLVHRLVARAFTIGGYAEHRRVSHLNGDKSINCVYNLFVPEHEDMEGSDCDSDESD